MYVFLISTSFLYLFDQQEAVRSLDSLDKSAIAEIRVYTNPPELVLIVMTAVCLLLQIPTDWNSAKMALSDPSFLKRLVQLDRDTIPNEVFSKLRKITKEERFNPEQVAQVILFFIFVIRFSSFAH